MPGHKGKPILGFEPYDVTEFDGADDLFAPEGVIAESEAIASELFGCRTYYSAGGSTLMIQAMLALGVGAGGTVAAVRNAHKSLLNTAVLLDLNIVWLYQKEDDPDIVCTVTAADVERTILESHPNAVYLTSPDYLGNVTEISEIAEVCHRYGVWLLVDNAHGAYLRFLKPSRHPMDLGADICCDSAHKTLPVVTGGSYLHLSKRAEEAFGEKVKDTMALFGSTSPSYLIMASLDAANPYLEQLPDKLSGFIPKVDAVKARLHDDGWNLIGTEPIKITLETCSYGYTGDEVAEYLLEWNIFSEFHDPEYIVFMTTPENDDADLHRLQQALLALPRKSSCIPSLPPRTVPEVVMRPRAAYFSAKETVPVDQACGRILASARIGCPPAIPLIMAGERIDESSVARMKYYGTLECSVVK